MSLNVVMAPSVAPIGSKLTINENGEYNVKDYAVADVNVEGGGGSSDFSTAEVTIVNKTGGNNTWNVLHATDEYIENSVDINRNLGKTIHAVLYKGYGYLRLAEGQTATATGEATIDSEFGMVYFTGDCTITIS